MDTMANIQGGLPAGLNEVNKHFGNKVELHIAVLRDRTNAREYRGWEHLKILESEGNLETIEKRLHAELERQRNIGVLSVAEYR